MKRPVKPAQPKEGVMEKVAIAVLVIVLILAWGIYRFVQESRRKAEAQAQGEFFQKYWSERPEERLREEMGRKMREVGGQPGEYEKQDGKWVKKE